MRLTVILSVALAAVPVLAHAHGIPVQFEADASAKLKSTQKFFWGEEATFAPFDATRQRFQAGIGVHDPTAGIPDGTVLSINLTGDPSAVSKKYDGRALLYWDGTKIAPTSQVLTITRSGTTVTVDGDDTFVAGPVIGAYTAATINWHGTTNFFLPLDAPTGLYAIGMQGTAPGHGASDTFWLIANVGLTEEQYAAGVAAIAQTVPEPATLVMAGVGLALVCVVGCRRSR